MTIYLLYIILLFLLTLIYSFREPPSFIVKTVFIAFFLLASLRSVNVGNDTQVYYRLFSEIDYLGEIVLSNGRFEIGFIYLNYFFRRFLDNFVLYLFILNSFIYVIYYRFISRYSKNKLLSSYLFFTLGFWGSTVNIMRIELALSFVLLAYMLFNNKKKKRAFLIWSISLLFHRISMFSIVLFFLPSKFGKGFYSITVSFLIIFYLLFDKFFNLFVKIFPYFASYYNTNYSHQGGALAISLYFLIHCFIFILYFIVTKNKYVRDNTKNYFVIIYFSLLCNILAYKFNLIDRIAHFFWVFILIFIPEILSYLNDRKNYTLLLVSLMLICFIFFISINIFRSEWNKIIPYEFFWRE